VELPQDLACRFVSEAKQKSHKVYCSGTEMPSKYSGRWRGIHSRSKKVRANVRIRAQQTKSPDAYTSGFICSLGHRYFSTEKFRDPDSRRRAPSHKARVGHRLATFSAEKISLRRSSPGSSKAVCSIPALVHFVHCAQERTCTSTPYGIRTSSVLGY